MITLEERNRSKPLYFQIYLHIKREIHEGRLKAGERLYSKRKLAESLGVSVNTVETAYSQLLNAYVSYAAEDFTAAGETIAGVDRNLLDADAQAVYDGMMTEVQSAMLESALEEGKRLYGDEDYQAAIQKFQEVVSVEPAYGNGEAAYYLAFAYNYIEDYPNALKWFRTTIDNTNRRSWRNTAEDMAEDLEAKGYTAAQ